MKLARCEFNERSFWALVDTDKQTVTPIDAPFSEWGPALTRSINEGAAQVSVLPLVDQSLALSEVRLLPPVEPVNRVVVAGAVTGSGKVTREGGGRRSGERGGFYQQDLTNLRKWGERKG